MSEEIKETFDDAEIMKDGAKMIKACTEAGLQLREQLRSLEKDFPGVAASISGNKGLQGKEVTSVDEFIAGRVESCVKKEELNLR